MDNKTHIKVHITKGHKIRAEITEPGGNRYSVTVGGNEWKKGKGNQYKTEIYMRVTGILIHVRSHILENLL